VGKQTVTQWVCDGRINAEPCGKVMRASGDGVLIVGSASSPDKDMQPQIRSSPRDDAAQTAAYCWSCFHRLLGYPETRIRTAEDQTQRQDAQNREAARQLQAAQQAQRAAETRAEEAERRAREADRRAADAERSSSYDYPSHRSGSGPSGPLPPPELPFEPPAEPPHYVRTTAALSGVR